MYQLYCYICAGQMCGCVIVRDSAQFLAHCLWSIHLFLDYPHRTTSSSVFINWNAYLLLFSLLQTTELACTDLERYYKALDRWVCCVALTTFWWLSVYSLPNVRVGKTTDPFKRSWCSLSADKYDPCAFTGCLIRLNRQHIKHRGSNSLPIHDELTENRTYIH